MILNKDLIDLEKTNENVELFRKNLITKIIPLVFYACDEDNNACAYFVWSSIVKCLNNSQVIIENKKFDENNNFWSLLNVKKAFIPKLIALIRHHGNGNANSQNCEIIFSSLILLLTKLSSAFDSENEKLIFYKEFFAKLNDAINNINKDANSKTRAGNIVSIRAKMICSLFDCLTFAVNELVTNDSTNEFCYFAIENYVSIIILFFSVTKIKIKLLKVLQIIDTYLDSKSIQENESNIELKFQNFVKAILENEKNAKINESFWTGLGISIRNKLAVVENHDCVLNNFNNLFKNYFQKANLVSKRHLNEIIKIFFDLFYDSFAQNLNRSERTLEINNQESIHLNGLNKLCSSFMCNSFLDWFLSKHQNTTNLNQEEKLNYFNKTIIENFVKIIMNRETVINDYSLYYIISLYLSINLKLNINISNNLINQSINDYLFSIESKHTDDQIENLLEKFLLESKQNLINSTLKLSLTKYIMQSEQIQNLIINKLFNSIRLFSFEDDRKYNNYELTIQLLDNLNNIDSVSKEKSSDTLDKFYKALIKTILDYMEHTKTFKIVNLNELNNYLLFSIDMIFNKSNLLDLKLLWQLIINHLIFKDRLDIHKQIQDANTAKIKTNLNNLINKLIEEFMTKYAWELKENYQDIINFISDNLSTNTDNIDSFELNKIIIDLIGHFEIVLSNLKIQDDKEWSQVFYSQVLLNLNGSVTFKDLFNNILFSNLNNDSINKNLIGKFYLNKRLNYLYSNYQFQLVKPEDDKNNKSVIDSTFLKNINYSLTILNNYLKTRHQNKSLFEDSYDWIYLLTSCIILSKIDSNELFLPSINNKDNIPFHFFQNRKLIKSIQNEFKKLIFQTKFLKLKLYTDNLDDLIDEIFSQKDENYTRLEINNLSLLITCLVDMTIEKPIDNEDLVNIIHTFSRDLFLKLTEKSDEIRITEEEIKLYIYDIPFAKHSVIDNLNKLGENVQHYYSLFSNLINEQVKQLSESVDKFKLLNKSYDPNEFLINIKTFNFNLDILTKYLTIYLSLLNKKPNSNSPIDVKLYQILNCNEITLQFIKNNLSTNLIKILDLFIDLKQSITTANKTTNPPYFFYFDFNLNKSTDDELKWEQFIQIDKLNSFLQLFFVDFKLNITSLQQQPLQQLSNLCLNNNKHWDFILCYVSCISQAVNKLDQTILDKSHVQILNINFFTLLNSLIKCIHYKVRDDMNGSYPKTVYSDWHGFFAKELLDPLLCLFVKYANSSVSQTTSDTFYTHNIQMDSLKRILIKKLSEVVALIPFERLLFNELEAKFNVLDLEISNLNVKTSKTNLINLTDQLKTVINHLVPHLKHQLKSVQLCSYKILRSLMKKMDKYYAVYENFESSGNEINIIESLPYVIRETLFQLTELFADLKNNIEFDQNILVGENMSCGLTDQDDYDENLVDESLFEEDDDDIEIDKINKNKCLLLKKTSKKYSSLIKQVQMKHDANNKLMSYLLINRLILDMFAGDELDFKVKLVNNLREIKFNENLINCLFRLMPSFKDSTLKLFSEINNSDIPDDLDEHVFDSLIKYNYEISFVMSSFDDNYESFTNKNVQAFACKLYKYALKLVPAMLRDWFNIQPKRIADLVDKYTTRYVSPVLLEEEIRQINRSVNQQLNRQPSDSVLVDTTKSATTAAPLGPAKKTIIVENDDESTIKIRGMLSTREIVTTYKMKELSMELIIHLPLNYPLGVIEVSSVRRLGVSENEWRNWLLQLTTYLTHQNGSIIQGLQIWKKNVDKKFNGVEECTICYSVIQCNDYSLPKMACRTCKKKFHKICLYKWFESSSKSTCPLCRNLF